MSSTATLKIPLSVLHGFITFLFILSYFIIVYIFTGSLVPVDNSYSLIFQGGLLLIILGSAVLEPYFTKPGDAFVNALFSLLSLTTVFHDLGGMLWYIITAYVLFVLLSSLITLFTIGYKHLSSINRITYILSTKLGSAKVIFSIIFIYSVFSFYSTKSTEAAILTMFWGFFILLSPPHLALTISRMFHSKGLFTKPAGTVVMTDWPNLVRVKLDGATNWDRNDLYVFRSPDGNTHLIVPLYKDMHPDGVIGTGLIVYPDDNIFSSIDTASITTGYVYECASISNRCNSFTLPELMGGSPSSQLIGFVVEESTIDYIRFEIWDARACHEGQLVWCRVGDHKIYYQIVSGYNREESLEANRRGYQVALAVQLGTINDENGGFAKFQWLPAMNEPVFTEGSDFGADLLPVHDGDFIYGEIPYSKVPVTGPLDSAFPYHTAVLGITGSGKTEFAFRVIEYAQSRGYKVLCIDLTKQYETRLDNPVNLSISNHLATELNDKLFEVETGKYGAGEEKKALKEFADKLRQDINDTLNDFLFSDNFVGIITLEEISNTKASLYITEIYLSTLLRISKESEDSFPSTLVVVEEAHTVMPEASTMGLGDFDSKGLVGKIAQIALQGRKYNVGLLVVAQRTATVSKSVLTQCNTVVCFTSYDDTSISFLKNYLGSDMASSLPNLPQFHAIIFGKGVRSRKPLIVRMPNMELGGS